METMHGHDQMHSRCKLVILVCYIRNGDKENRAWSLIVSSATNSEQKKKLT